MGLSLLNKRSNFGLKNLMKLLNWIGMRQNINT